MVYYFRFETKPAENNRYFGRIGYGEANIFVSGAGCDDDVETMEVIARAYINAQSWVVANLLEIHETNPPAPDWAEELTELYDRAIHAGVSGFFSASPDIDIPGGPVLCVRPY